jgi:hypothetical protein
MVCVSRKYRNSGHNPSSEFSKHGVSESGLCLHLQVSPVNLIGVVAGIRREMESGLRNVVFKKYRRWIMPRIMIVILIYNRDKHIDSINLLGS